jgi:hypothetical protein
VPVCAAHHSKMHGALRSLTAHSEWKRCSHHHPYPEGRAECERRLNAA